MPDRPSRGGVRSFNHQKGLREGPSTVDAKPAHVSGSKSTCCSSSSRRLRVLVFETFLQFWPSRRIAAPIIETARGLCNASRIFAGGQRTSALVAQLLHTRTDRLEIVSNARSRHVFLPYSLFLTTRQLRTPRRSEPRLCHSRR